MRDLWRCVVVFNSDDIEGFLGIMKRRMGYIGGAKRDGLYLFLAEIVWKFNHRHQSLKDQEQALLELVLRD